MFRYIKVSDESVIGSVERPTYIKTSDNGCFVICDEDDYCGVAFEGSAYHVVGRPSLGDDIVDILVDFVDSGSEITNQGKAIDDIDAMSVDQEYRITMLELGLS